MSFRVVIKQMKPVLRLVQNYGIALIVVGTLIWFPYTGFFLTILTGGLLPSLICNLFLVHLAYVVCTKRSSLGWLAVPIVCYGVWLSWVISQNNAVSVEKSRLEGENHITVTTSPNVTLVFPVNEADSLAFVARRHLAPSVRIFVGSTELCCSTEPPSTPPVDAIIFHRLEGRDPNSKSGTYRYRYELRQLAAPASDRVVGHFNYGTLRAPVWAPVFVAGCFLIDEPSAWSCVISPMLRRVPVGETGYAGPYEAASGMKDRIITTLANMLGVKYIEDEPRRAPPKMPPMNSVPNSKPSVSDTNETIHRD
jgi:hypothetical protein